ncbi:MAG TPA: hypothetical protein VMY59_09260 [Candidatus Thermoplasmatota archaeon]|nr:hypothetical protein [Candidatus Thermoplasmatota archaeon]
MSDELDYFEVFTAKGKCYECKACCNLKYCMQGKLNIDWLRRIGSDNETVRPRKSYNIRVRRQPKTGPRFKLSLAAG